MQALWMVLASFLFASMGVCVKLASSNFNAFELVLYRGLVGMVFMALIVQARGSGLRTRFAGMQAWRSLIGVISLIAWFYAIAYLPLATAVTLNYMSSIWVATFLIGGALLHARGPMQPRQGLLMLTVLTGFGGVVMILRPTLEQNQLFAGLIGLMSGLLAALAYIQVTALASPRNARCFTLRWARPWAAASASCSPGCLNGTLKPPSGCCRLACWPRWASGA